MKLLEHEYEFVKVGKLEVATTNIYYPKLAIGENNRNCYFNYSTVCKIDELLVAEDTGFHIPTIENFNYLFSLGSHCVNAGEKDNEIAGCFFGRHCKEATLDDLKDSVFFPALGLIDSSSLSGQGSYAYYWSSTCPGHYIAYALCFSNYVCFSTPRTDSYNKRYGFSGRFVRDLKKTSL
jgi:uncharacterized protein (TIGR02145 family)